MGIRWVGLVASHRSQVAAPTQWPLADCGRSGSSAVRRRAISQLVLERLANMAIELFARACVISRTQSLLDEKGEEACERELCKAQTLQEFEALERTYDFLTAQLEGAQ